MSVALGEGETRESFEADVLDFTRAGASMRAPYLPEIGTQLECRFRCGLNATAVATRGEVVWAQLEGESSGEFGLAFVDLDPQTEWLIEEMLAEPIGRHSPEPAPEEPQAEPITQLELEGSDEPISTRLARQQSGTAVFEQHLDLLSLGRGVRAHAPGAGDRSGSIAGVELRMVGNVPMLAVTVNFEEEAAAAGAAREMGDPNLPHDTVLDMSAPRLAGHDDDERVPHSTTLTEYRLSERAAARGDASPARRGSTDSLAAGLDTAGLGPAPLQEREASLQFAIAAPDDGVVSSESDQGDDPLGGGALQARLDAMTASVRGFWEAAQQRMDARSAALRERWQAWHSNAGLDLQQLYQQEVGSRFGAIRRLLLPRRRTASSPSAQRRAAPSLSQPQLALMIGGAVVLVVVGLLALFSGSSEHEVKPALVAQTPADPVTDVPAVEPEPEAASPEPAQPGRPLAAASRPRSRTLGMPADEAPMGATLEGAGAVSTATAIAELKPQAPARAGKPRFGAAQLPRGTRFPIRMSAPIQSLDGKASADGFTVTVVGAQSLDPAAPLVKRYPGLISKAKILNERGAAQLEIRFAKGKQPLYQLIAEESVLYIALRDR